MNASSKGNAKARRAEQVAQLRAEAARRERNRRLVIAGSVVAAVVVVIVALVVVKLSTDSKDNGAASSSGASSTLVESVTSIPSTTLDAIGAGNVANGLKPLDGAPALTSDGKPLVLYAGGEFCPYCAATRWGFIVALSRFGTFTDLGETTSSSNDVFPDTATLSFHGASYASKYIALHAYETLDRQQKPLDTPTAEDQATIDAYSQGIPFIDFGGKFVQSGTAIDPTPLQGKTHEEIAAAIRDPDSDIAAAVGGQANQMTAAICVLTNQQPAAVCSSAGVQAAAASLGAG